MKIKILLLACPAFFGAACCSLLATYATAQNLVGLNYSFELYDTCPGGASQLDYVAYWFNPTKSTPDYFNACSDSFYGVSVPSNYFGYQDAKTGVAYAGIFTYWPDDTTVSFTFSYREYIEVQLSSPLQSGKKYCVQFNVSLADSFNYATDDIGAYLSANSVTSDTFINLPYTPQIGNPEGNFITDKSGWTLISGEYTAQGGEQFITIGNFKDYINTDTLWVGGGAYVYPDYYAAYYYIDDVSVTLCDSVGGFEQIENNKPIKIYSTSKGVYNIYPNDNQIKNICVYNLLGQLILSPKTSDNIITIDLSAASNGIYFINIQTKNNNIVHKIFLF